MKRCGGIPEESMDSYVEQIEERNKFEEEKIQALEENVYLRSVTNAKDEENAHLRSVTVVKDQEIAQLKAAQVEMLKLIENLKTSQ